jgi:hypothetical protein
MTPTFHENPQTHNQHLETILFQCTNVLGFGQMAQDANTAERRAEALDALKIKARALMGALQSAHFKALDTPPLAIPFPVGEKVRIHTANHLGTVGQVIAQRVTNYLGDVDVQLANGTVLPVRNCDLEKA